LKDGDFKYEHKSFYPVLEGIKNKVLIVSKYTWKNELEGEVTCSYGNEKIEFDFYAPFYAHDFMKTEINTEIDVGLAGLAISIKQPQQEMKFKNGALYEIQLKEFLKNNHGKSASDMPDVVVRTAGATGLLPTNVNTVHYYCGVIAKIETINFDNQICAKILIRVTGSDDTNGIFINLYCIKSDEINDSLIEGADIEGMMYLMGYTNA
jgi:hypothetical protein